MIAGILLVLTVALYRLLPVFLGFTTQQPDWFISFSPVTAIIFCGAACLPRRWALTLPFGTLLGTDFILNYWYGHPLFNALLVAKTVAFCAIAYFGWQLRSQARVRVLLPAAIGSSFFFYLVTNTGSWLYDPLYTKSFLGWAQALTSGLPGFQPTWMFLRNQLASDAIFTLLFLACVRPSRAVAAEKRPALAGW